MQKKYVNVRKELHGLTDELCTNSSRINQVETKQEVNHATNPSPSEVKIPVELNTPEHRKERLQKLIDRFPEVFATAIKDLHVTDLIEHDIDTGDHEPIAVRPYRGNPIRNAEINDYVRQLYEGGQIEPSNSPWAAACLIVPKKTLPGEPPATRFVIDYSLMNSKTVNTGFPTPSPETVFDLMAGKKYYSNLDLFSSFWQINLSEKTRRAGTTAFVCSNPPSHWQWVRMPMGLKTASQTMQRLLMKVLAPMIGVSVYVFIDDCLIYSDTEEEHWEHIEQAFELLKAAHLKLKLKKCEFFKQEVKYLGHVITTKGVKPDDEKVEKIVNFPIPRSVKEVKSILGISSFYRKYIKGYSQIVEPLLEKTRSSYTKFHWDERDQKAFDEIKKILTTEPLLLHPRFDLPFQIASDASGHSLGAVLQQEQDGRVGPIAYASRRLTDEERRYSATQRELLSVIWSLKYFRKYFAGQKEPVLILNDHRPLMWLTSMKEDEGRVGRWCNYLMSVNHKLVHKKGTEMGHADTLSRIPLSDNEQAKIVGSKQHQITINVITGEKLESMAELQTKDALCIKIRKYMDEGNLDAEDEIKRPVWASEIDFYVMHEGTLYREATMLRRNHKHFQLVAPFEIRRKILEIMHNSRIGMHFAFRRTYLRTAAKFYWPEMKANVEEYCKACGVCMANRSPGPKAFLTPNQLATRPGMCLGLDFFGPVQPESTEGHKYVIIIVDHFSKFIKLRALKDITAVTAAEALLQEHVYNEGFFQVLVSDRGVQFTSNVWKELSKLLGFKQHMSTSFHAQTDGASERGLKMMKTQLKKMLIDRPHAEWHLLLGPLKWAYNDSIHDSTLQSPYYLERGRDMGSFINTALDLDSQPSVLGIPQDYISQLTDRLRFAFHSAREAMLNARNKQKRQYDKKAGFDKFEVGCKVLLDKRLVLEGESRKFVPKYSGIYRIIRKYDNNTVDITDNSYKIQRVHLNRLKLVYESQIYRDEAFEKFDPTEQIIRYFHNNVETQTNEMDPRRTATAPTTRVGHNTSSEVVNETVDFGVLDFRVESFGAIVLPVPIEVSRNYKLHKLLPKRKPGRPRKEKALHSSFKKKAKKVRKTKMKRKVRAVAKKTKTKPKDVIKPVIENEEEPALVKRPRGRPRKHPMVVVTDANLIESNEKKGETEKTPKSKTLSRPVQPRKTGLRKKELLKSPKK